MGHANVGLVIALPIGGKSTQVNDNRHAPELWPEAGKLPNVKDKLEFEIYDRVCERGTMTVTTARMIFRGDWTTAYRRYVG